MNGLHLSIDGQQRGPFTMGQLQGMWGNGAITSETLYWQEGMTEWLPLGDLVEQSAPARRSTPPPLKKPIAGWSGGEYLLLVVLTILIPLIGLLIGFIKVWEPAKRQQAGQLMGIAVLMMVVTWVAFSIFTRIPS